jgi:hypothetical protein
MQQYTVESVVLVTNLFRFMTLQLMGVFRAPPCPGFFYERYYSILISKATTTIRDVIRHLIVVPHYGMFLMQTYLKLNSTLEKHLVSKEGSNRSSNQRSNEKGQPIRHTVAFPMTKESHKTGSHATGWIDSSTKRRKWAGKFS